MLKGQRVGRTFPTPGTGSGPFNLPSLHPRDLPRGCGHLLVGADGGSQGSLSEATQLPRQAVMQTARCTGTSQPIEGNVVSFSPSIPKTTLIEEVRSLKKWFRPSRRSALDKNSARG